MDKPGSTERFSKPFSRLWTGFFNLIIDLLDAIMGRLQQRIGLQRMAYVFVLPNLLIFSIFILLPMALNFYYAFTGGSEIFPQDRPFVGAHNFQTLAACGDFRNPNSCEEDLFWRAASNMSGFVVTEVPLMVAVSLATALILNRQIRARGFFRSVFFFPVLLSPVVVALIWKWILQQDGLLNSLLISLGGNRIFFLGDAAWARFWVIVISAWAQMGFFTLILLAGLQAIPKELYEASAIDGANNWEAFSWLTLPLLMPTMLVVLVLSLIRAVQVFDQVFPFTGGGPGTATLYMVQYIYKTGFSDQAHRYGLAAAASVVLAVILLVLTVLQLRLSRNSDY
ncbi:MAG: carbohydrate ABC transporter permease [Aggregatilineales bacterium]